MAAAQGAAGEAVAVPPLPVERRVRGLPNTAKDEGRNRPMRVWLTPLLHAGLEEFRRPVLGDIAE